MSEEVIRIAFADDHIAVRETISFFLAKSGTISVDIKARNGSELLEMIAKCPQLPDICMLDINMPVKNGFDTQMELKEKWPEIRTLVLTAHESELSIIRMILAGAKGYLLKNCGPGEIEKAIRSIYSNGIYHSEMANSSLFRAVEHKKIKLPVFTDKEIEVLKYCCSDLSYEKIGKQMGSTRRSVEGHRDSLFKKLNVNSRTMLALYAVELGLIPQFIKSNFRN